MWLGHYNEIWLVDFEFRAPPGGRPEPVCLAAREFHTGRRLRLWQHDLQRCTAPPYPIDDRTLFVAYYASAEVGCHLALGWPAPSRVLDLYPEFRRQTAGLAVPHGYGLLGALTWHGLDAMEAVQKAAMRDLVLRGAPWSPEERRSILDYCEQDVDALAHLLPAMAPHIDLPRALLRGRYMNAAAHMEYVGVPIDADTLERLRLHWNDLRHQLIGAVDTDYGVYDGGSFREDRWADYLERHGIAWPRLDSGALALDDDTFREVARIHSAEVGPIRELRHALVQLRLNDLAVGPDGRNRVLLSAFASKTGRNQPSTSKFIFGPSCWLRSLIKPDHGRAVAYCDYSQQELAIAAALSQDAKMIAAYTSGDFYLTFGQMAGAIPAGATKRTHAKQREQFKVVSLGVLYGLSAYGIARKLAIPEWRGKDLLRMHQQAFRDYWRWSNAVETEAMLGNPISTVFGWTVRAGPNANPRSLRNFPVQANGAEMLRLACCKTTEAGVLVCAPVHDALLVEGPAGEIDRVVSETQRHMREASEVVLDGFSLRTDAKTVRYPDRYADERGTLMWKRVMSLLPPRATIRAAH